MDILSIKAVLLSLILCGGSLTIANTAIEPYQEPKVVAVYQDSEDTKCFKIKDSEQNICYKVELPVQASAPSVPDPTPQPNIGEGVEQWREIVAKYFPAESVNTALRVMEKESGGNPTSHNDNPATKDDSYGLFQINLYGRLAESRPSPEELFDPEKNIQFAAQVFQSSGWNPWKNTMRKLGF